MTAIEFSNVIQRVAQSLRPVAFNLTRDTDDAKDLVQETVLKALMNREKFKAGTNLKAWLYTIMRNIFINNYRRNKKFTKVTSDIPEDIIMFNVDKKASNMGWSNTRVKEITQEIEQLPQAFRQSFELYNMGYKYNDIAEMLNEPLGTVKSRIHFARKILSSKIER